MTEEEKDETAQIEAATKIFFERLSPLHVQLEGEVLEIDGVAVGGLIGLLEEEDTEYFGDVVKAMWDLVKAIRRVEDALYLIPDADEENPTEEEIARTLYDVSPEYTEKGRGRLRRLLDESGDED